MRAGDGRGAAGAAGRGAAMAGTGGERDGRGRPGAAPDLAEILRRAEHELALEGSSLRAADVPECRAMLAGTMTVAEAVASLRLRHAAR